MTVIVGAVMSNGHVTLACDSRISDGRQEHDGGYTKIWADEERKYVFGGAGDLRAIQVVQSFTDWPIYHTDEDEDAAVLFGVRELVVAIRNAVKDHGVMKSEDGVESIDCSLLVGWRENLLLVDGNFSVTFAVYDRAAIGSGASEAYGALGDSGKWTAANLVEAVRRSSVTASGVGGDIYRVDTRELVVSLTS